MPITYKRKLFEREIFGSDEDDVDDVDAELFDFLEHDLGELLDGHFAPGAGDAGGHDGGDDGDGIDIIDGGPADDVDKVDLADDGLEEVPEEDVFDGEEELGVKDGGREKPDGDEFLAGNVEAGEDPKMALDVPCRER